MNNDPFNSDNSDLFDNSAMTPIEGEGPSNRGTKLVILSVALLGCGCIFILAFFLFQPDAASLVSEYFPSPTRTFTPTVTFTPSQTSTPTPNLTAQGYESTAVFTVNEWYDEFTETFDTNNYDWYVGTDDDAYAKITYAVNDGKYIWDATSHQGFVQWVWIAETYIEDFYFSLEATQPGFTTAADYGIIFRQTASRDYYYFSVNNKSRFSLWLRLNEEWTELIESTPSSAIHPREPNKLSMLAEGNHFILFINDQFVAEFTDNTIAEGRVGMAIEISDPDINVIFEFDNILVKVPK